jgi:predicted  nucleic acid-binding Zn-ribbon protein
VSRDARKAKRIWMAFEDIKAEIALLFEQMVNQPQDAHEIRETVREKLNALRASGLPLPADLVELEKRIEQDFDS